MTRNLHQPLWRKALWAGWQRLAHFAGRRYIAGATVAEAVQTSRQLAGQNFASTICYWNGEQDAPALVAQHYLDILNELSAAQPDSYLSIKATALHYSREWLNEIAARAAAANVRLHFDAMWPDSAEPTLALMEELRARQTNLSCTLPGRWQRSLTDAARINEWQIPVRVVKGQWADPEHPDIDLRAGYLAVIERLAGRAAHVAVATHDHELAAMALERLIKAGTSCELELLFGLPTRAVLRVARSAGVPVRIYVPYGAAWAPYCLSQARRNPRILWWVLRDATLGRAATMMETAYGTRVRTAASVQSRP
ncbi:MAG: proline dehydrogenase [Acidobacteria bacterium]|nr:proline dehydrogenase [Acidobacteriota bacterium]MBI3423102.1 proline dehydrogenase [Acidobacteriota bacterium]